MSEADLDQKIRAALAAFEEKRTSLEEFESTLGSAMNSAGAERGAVETTLRKAAAAGVLPRETLIRFGVHVTGIPERESREDTVSSDPEPQQAGADEQVGVGWLLNGRYRLERQLGAGGMGVVYFASDQQARGESYAVKVLKPEIREHPEALQLLEEEARQSRRMRNENIVGVYSLNLDGPIAYILMEYLEGQTLDTLLDDEFGRGMPFYRAWPLIEDIGAGLAYAHDHSVIHSDLKPSNVFVTTAGRAKLLDFGIARAARGKVRGVDPGTLGALTEAYASLEMFENGAPDQRDDIYAFGCVIYEMLTGKHPFEGLGAPEALKRGLRPPPIASLTGAQNQALARSLAFKRAERTGTVEALIAGLEPPKPNPKSPGVPKAVWLTVGAAAIVIAVLAVWFIPRWVVPPKPAAAAPVAVDATNADAVVARVAALEQRAKREFAVDTDQRSWIDWEEQFASAKSRLAANGPNAMQQLLLAESALKGIIRGGSRSMVVGSTPPEIDQALQQCRNGGTSLRDCNDAMSGEEARTVQFRPFELDPTEVSNRAFAEFAAATGYVTLAEGGHRLLDYAGDHGLIQRPAGESWKTLRDAMAKEGGDPGEYPVRGVDFQAATKYCDWKKKRLPTGDEWEFVARGPERHIFPSGDAWPSRDEGRPRHLLPVSEQPVTGRFGNRGLGGALWEWVEGGTGDQRMLRGVSWRDNTPWHQRLATLRLEPSANPFVDSGFRCARSVDGWPDAAL
jgi:formylglycine-generating enzyme required for sulfatase activity